MAETGIITRMHPTVQDIAAQDWNGLLDRQPRPAAGAHAQPAQSLKAQAAAGTGKGPACSKAPKACADMGRPNK